MLSHTMMNPCCPVVNNLVKHTKKRRNYHDSEMKKGKYLYKKQKYFRLKNHVQNKKDDFYRIGFKN